jgi:hypothetical protein
LNFKNKGLDDDPFGLFSASSPATQTPPQKAPLSSEQVLDDKEPSSASPFSAPPTISPKQSLPDLDFSATPPPPKMESLGAEAGPQQAPSLRLEPPEPSLSVPSGYGEVSLTEPLPQTIPSAGKRLGFHNLLILAKQWTRFYFHKLVGLLEPASEKLHIPSGVLAVLVLVLLAGFVLGLGALMPASAVKLVDRIPPIHLVEVTAAQIGDMDITAYTEFQNQLQTMGFTDILQFTIPQLPNTNFMDVEMKHDVSTYSEIIKFPSTIVPRVSFVTVFTNGVWYSTNGWDGKAAENAWRVSEFFPDTPLDQLYVKHVQRVQQMESDSGWQAQSLNENRYMAAVSDEIRTVLTDTKIEAYNVNLALWH